MKIIVNSKVSDKYRADIKVYCVEQKSKDTPKITTSLNNDRFKKVCDLGDFKAEEGEIFIDYTTGSPASNFKRVVFVGLGRVKSDLKKSVFREKMRIAGGHIAKLCKKLNVSKLCIMVPDFKDQSHLDTAVYCLTEGIVLGEYTFNKYITDAKKKSKFNGIKEIKFICEKNVQSLRQTAALAHGAATAACHARDMANEPGNGWTPANFAEYAEEIAKKHKLKCTVFDKKQMEKMGMGGILAVNKGSDLPPKLVILEYLAHKKAQTILLVGKGVTFDSGGISIKPAGGMEDMKYDMCGGAAVLAAMHAVANEKPDCNVVAIVPATDNLSGGSALKPGDIIHHYNKRTSEIINTDAEGRLILADALAYGIELCSPDYVIDLATLTGAVIIGLGHHHSGVFSNNDKLAGKLIAAGDLSGEPLWRLPLGPDYKKQLDSKVADLKNTGGRPAGAITAAEYLHAFVGETPWAHLDIAGTAWNFTEKSYIPEGGPSGIGVRTLIEFIRKI
jgi:leucyl aminopeptidase